MCLERPSSLPTELERWIFEIAAFIHPSCMPVLMLVAQRVKIWIEPLLYRVLCIGEKPPDSEEIWIPLERIHYLIEGRPLAPAFLHDNVRHLCLILSGTVHMDDIMRVLVACDATVDLHLLGGSRSLLPHFGKLPLRRLSVDLAYLFRSPDFTHPVFGTITHLSLTRPGFHWTHFSGLAQMPCLTHLSYDDILSPLVVCEHALRDCKSLEVLALSFSNMILLEPLVDTYAPLATDPRFVMLLATHRVRDWETGARGGDDYWVRADELVRKRRSGEINEYYLFSDD
ncbi:hypothetical protein C8R44DRAFT_799234 [Mycena epipterygia]|nr:hypothetical protein C8R44DRAFT_799234 [Mycena epipterygia]